MVDSSQILINLIHNATPTDGFHETNIPGVDCIKFSVPRPWSKARWRASFVIIVQGYKDVALEANSYRYEQAHYIATAVDLPVSSRVVEATKALPFLAIRIALDPVELNEVASKMKFDFVEAADMKTHGIFADRASDNLLEAMVRLARLFGQTADAEVLGGILLREIYYYLLMTRHGAAIRQFSAEGSKLHSIAESIKEIKSDLGAKLDIEHLARRHRMSRTSYFSAFKQVTAMSPIQYQKKMRLMEAKQLLLIGGETAESVAYRVGYKSISQFSREYSRLFGNPPGRDSIAHFPVPTPS